MRQNYPPRLEMQIPQERTYTGLEIISKNDKLEEFINDNYKIPSDNINEIKNFIAEDGELERIIYGLPEIISEEFPESHILLDFSEFSLTDEQVLEIIVKTEYDGETTSNKKDVLIDKLMNNYDSFRKDYFISMEF